jgi:hypothetical protein
MEIGDTFQSPGPPGIHAYLNETKLRWRIQASRIVMRPGNSSYWTRELVCPPERGIIRVPGELPTWQVVEREEVFQFLARKRKKIYGWLPAGEGPFDFRRPANARMPSELWELLDKTGDPKRAALGRIAEGYIMYSPHYFQALRYPKVTINPPEEQERILKELLAVRPPAGVEWTEGLFSIQNWWVEKVKRRYFPHELLEALAWGVEQGLLRSSDLSGTYIVLRKP